MTARQIDNCQSDGWAGPMVARRWLPSYDQRRFRDLAVPVASPSKERVCELHPRAEEPSPRPSPGGRGSINRRFQFANDYRMASHIEFTDRL